MKNIVQKVTCSGAVINDGKILILQRASDDDFYPNLWELPSGKKEPLEKVEDAAMREVKEETGLNVKVKNIIFTFNFIVDKPDETRDVTQLVFATELTGEADVRLSDEHQDFRWITEGELNDFNISPETKEAIQRAFSTTL